MNQIFHSISAIVSCLLMFVYACGVSQVSFGADKSSGSSSTAPSEEKQKRSFHYAPRLAFYAGVATPTTFKDMVRFQVFEFDPYGLAALVFSQPFYSDLNYVRLELEAGYTQHFESIETFTVNLAFVLRFIKTPLGKGASFGLGYGLSWANQIPLIEQRTLNRTNPWLIFVALELEYLIPTTRLTALLRIHHRSGMFSAFNGVIGGSDFVTLGARYAF